MVGRDEGCGCVVKGRCVGVTLAIWKDEGCGCDVVRRGEGVALMLAVRNVGVAGPYWGKVKVWQRNAWEGRVGERGRKTLRVSKMLEKLNHFFPALKSNYWNIAV